MSTLTIFAIVALSLFGLVVLHSIFVMPFMKRNAARKQEARLSKIISGFKAGDKILLASGIRGYFVKRKGDVIYVEIAKGVTIKADRHAVMGVYN